MTDYIMGKKIEFRWCGRSSGHVGGWVWDNEEGIVVGERKQFVMVQLDRPNNCEGYKHPVVIVQRKNIVRVQP